MVHRAAVSVQSARNNAEWRLTVQAGFRGHLTEDCRSRCGGNGVIWLILHILHSPTEHYFHYFPTAHVQYFRCIGKQSYADNKTTLISVFFYLQICCYTIRYDELLFLRALECSLINRTEPRNKS